MSMTVRLACVVLALLGSSCGRYESCDPNQTLQFNVCFPGPSDAAPAAPGNDGAVAGDGAADLGASSDGAAACEPPAAPAMCTAAAAGFGDACSVTSQCHCSTDLCAVIPGQSCGFCTRSGCKADPSICPAGWTCYDASAYQAGYSLCVKF
jgi:hypothetical protein